MGCLQNLNRVADVCASWGVGRYTAAATDHHDSITVSVTSDASGAVNVTGSPAHVGVYAHSTSPPYVRCDSYQAPATLVVAGEDVVCHVYGVGPGDRASLAATVAEAARGGVSTLEPQTSAGLTFVYSINSQKR